MSRWSRTVACAPAPQRSSTRQVRRGQRGAVLTLAAVTALGLLGACSADEPETPDPVTVTPDVESSRSAPPEPDVPTVWPLTGVETDAVPERPAVGVKIENTASARPQSGLEAADVVWETIVEFEVSRFIAVYHSQVPDEVGPIRSVRPVDPRVLAPLQGLIAYSGGQPRMLAEVEISGLQAVSHDAGDPGMYRVSSRRAPHNVYGSVEAFMDQAGPDNAASPAEQFAFATSPELAGAAQAGTEASSLSFVLSSASRPSWTWDSTTSTWLRSEAGVAATAASGARLSAVNVVSITAPHPDTSLKAQGGTRVPTYELVGEGAALVATGGRTLEGTWSKGAVDEPLQLFDADGDPLLLAPGNTWVELVPSGKGSVTVG